MASADSGPAAPAALAAPARPARGIEFKGRRIIGPLQHLRQKGMRGGELAVAARVRQRLPQIGACGPCARANSSSSPMPQSGERSSAARVRSSSRCSTNRPSAIRSITAICSVSTTRSAPATGMPRASIWRMTSLPKGSRRGRRIMMSPRRDRLVVAGQAPHRCSSSPRSCPATCRPGARPGFRVCTASTGAKRDLPRRCRPASAPARIRCRLARRRDGRGARWRSPLDVSLGARRLAGEHRIDKLQDFGRRAPRGDQQAGRAGLPGAAAPSASKLARG